MAAASPQPNLLRNSIAARLPRPGSSE
jgi:hypothetical protein